LSCLLATHSCVMSKHKNDLSMVSTRSLVGRRRRLALRLGDVEQVLAGSLVQQTRRCGKVGCRCAAGEPHGPYAYFAPRTAGRSGLRYVPSGLVDAVRARIGHGEQVQAVLAEISAINAELLSRRELR
jgi:Family of unknown function (DUF6788)